MILWHSVLLSVLLASAVRAAPVDEYDDLLAGFNYAEQLQTIFPGTDDVLRGITNSGKSLVEDTKKVIKETEEAVERWVVDGQEFIKQHGILCE